MINILAGALGFFIALVFSLIFGQIPIIIRTGIPLANSLYDYPLVTSYIQVAELIRYYKKVILKAIIICTIILACVFIWGGTTLKIIFSIYAVFSVINSIASSGINENNVFDFMSTCLNFMLPWKNVWQAKSLVEEAVTSYLEKKVAER